MNRTVLLQQDKAMVSYAVADFRTASVIEDAEAKVVAKLELAHRKLREARQELSEAVMLTLDLKQAGNDIADQVIEAVAEIAPPDFEQA